MFLLIHHTVHNHSIKEISLHSTMFLLIPKQDSCQCRCDDTLHSTMFLLIPIRKCRRQCRKAFTFHDVSINTGLRFDSGRSACSLHSTMFLLIPLKAYQESRKEVSLHSTMFLLIQDTITFSDESFFLYIPRCFY